jgi:Barstar (barnase inhibitor)
LKAPEPVVVEIPVEEIHDWESFHTVFARVLGFPSFYGRNMNAWIDCMTSIDHPEQGMTSIHAAPGGVLVLQLGECTEFAQRCPEQYEAILDSTAFVNYRRIETQDRPVLAVSCYNARPLRTPKKT